MLPSATKTGIEAPAGEDTEAFLAEVLVGWELDWLVAV